MRKELGKAPERTISGYTIGVDGRFVGINYTEPGDSGRVFYFFTHPELAQEWLDIGFLTKACGVERSRFSILPCTHNELESFARASGASITFLGRSENEDTSQWLFDRMQRNIVNQVVNLILSGKDMKEISRCIDDAGWCATEELKRELLEEANELIKGVRK